MPLGTKARVRDAAIAPYDIYLHDTPNHDLFARQQRALSHGCVRVDDALDLAAAVLAPAFSTSSLQEAVASGQTRLLPLAAPLPVYVLYMTASGADGAVEYAEDIYGRDAALVAALDAPASYPVAAGFASTTSECGSGR
ncbi:MAG: L,D-transpeptidase family protein [Hyphomonadaceae bacterium]